MNILVAAATEMEIKPFLQYIEEKKYQKRDCTIDRLITGVGLVHTTYSLTRYLSRHQPDLIIQAGIGGSFHPFYPPGAVVIIKEEIIADAGVEERGEFRDLFDMQLIEDALPYTGKVLANPHYTWLDKVKLSKVTAVSVNEITTRPERIQVLQEKYGAVIESMEGAALHYVCLQENVPFLQWRAVSNFAGERDKSKWKMQEAIHHLNEQLTQFVHTLLC